MRSLAIACLAALSLAAGCSRGSPGPAASVSPDEARALLINRNWIDRMPESKKERLHVYRFVPQMGGGVYQDRTLFAGQFELFKFEHTGDQIRFILPHTDERRTVGYRIEALRPGEVEGPFDLRLRLDRSPRGPATYYGVRSESHGDLEEGLKALLQGR